MLYLLIVLQRDIVRKSIDLNFWTVYVKELGEVMRLAFSKARSRICTRRKTRRNVRELGEDYQCNAL